MLLEFSVKNFRSIKEKQTLSLVADKGKELLEKNTFQTGLKNIPRAVHSAVIYGPNAAGKSNFILAMEFVEETVLSSAKAKQEGEPFRVKPFLFDANTEKEPSEFEIHFMQADIRYQYGFTVSPRMVVNEWLSVYPKGRPQVWFERKYNVEKEKHDWIFGSFFKGNREMIANATRKNALFLSTAIQLNNEQLKPVYDWFEKTLVVFDVGFGEVLGDEYTKEICEENKDAVKAFLAAADLSILDIKLEREAISPERFKFASDFPSEIKEMMMKSMQTRVKVAHRKTLSSEPVFLDLQEESDGTRKLFALAAPWLNILSQGRVVFVDELNSSLHPLMVRHLIELVNTPALNKSGAQLIFTTHDTSLLDADIFRRDQVWFVEKDKENSTHLYPLTEFSPRQGEALGKGYLKGRYGALPFIGEIKIS
jgi:AAA15 family ATPase/GTPase